MTDTFVRHYSPLNDTQKSDMDFIKLKAEELLHAMQSASNYADARMLSLAKDFLETSVMWAIKGVTNPPKAN